MFFLLFNFLFVCLVNCLSINLFMSLFVNTFLFWTVCPCFFGLRYIRYIQPGKSYIYIRQTYRQCNFEYSYIVEKE